MTSKSLHMGEITRNKLGSCLYICPFVNNHRKNLVTKRGYPQANIRKILYNVMENVNLIKLNCKLET